MKQKNKIITVLFLFTTATIQASKPKKAEILPILQTLKEIDENPYLELDFKPLKKACNYTDNKEILQRILSIQFKILYYCIQRISLEFEGDLNVVPLVNCNDAFVLHYVESHKLNLTATLLWALEKFKNTDAIQKATSLSSWAFLLINDFVPVQFENFTPLATKFLTHDQFDEVCQTLASSLTKDSYKKLLKKNFYGLRKILSIIPENMVTKREPAYLYHALRSEFSSNTNRDFIINDALYAEFKHIRFDIMTRLQQEFIMHAAYENYKFYTNHGWPEDYSTPVKLYEENDFLPVTKLKSVGWLLDVDQKKQAIKS
jgi:hypothetical protein